MPMHRPHRKMSMMLLVFVALVVGSSFGAAAAAAGAGGQRVASAANTHGNPHAVPPILALATPSELAAIRQVEAQEATATAYRLPASAEYSLAGLNGYTVTAGK